MNAAFKVTFYKRKRLLNERIRDHITRKGDYFLCLNCRECDRPIREFAREIETVKNRSPNVWRNNFVLLFHGPTISRAVVKQLDQAGLRMHE